MYEVLKSVISTGGYKLTEIMHKTKKMYVLGDLTEAQMDELLLMASGGVSADAERPETLAMIRTLADEIKALTVRVAALEDTDNGSDNGDVVEPEQPAYPEWKSWDGISTDYQHGAVVSHNGELWESIFNGQNVWEPGAVGTESLWVKYTEENSEE